MFTCDAGGAANRALHIYFYDDFEQRDFHRQKMRSSPAWNEGYLTLSRPCVSHQVSARPAVLLSLSIRLRCNTHECKLCCTLARMRPRTLFLAHVLLPLRPAHSLRR